MYVTNIEENFIIIDLLINYNEIFLNVDNPRKNISNQLNGGNYLFVKQKGSNSRNEPKTRHCLILCIPINHVRMAHYIERPVVIRQVLDANPTHARTIFLNCRLSILCPHLNGFVG